MNVWHLYQNKMGKRTINIKIAGKSYPVEIEPQEESLIRESVDVLKAVVDQEYGARSRNLDDVLIFFAINSIRENLLLKQQLASFKDEAADLSDHIKAYLASNTKN